MDDDSDGTEYDYYETILFIKNYFRIFCSLKI